MKTFACMMIMMGLAGCASAGGNHSAKKEFPPMPALVFAPSIAPTPGAIYSESPGGLGLFMDQKAHQPGDLLTIQLFENTKATTKAETSTSKDSSANTEAAALAGAPLTLSGRNVLALDATGTQSFSGNGASSQSNSLAGSITVTVVQRLPNGNLVVQGEKHLLLNQSNELVQIQGIVRTADISPDNTIPSSRIANVRIKYGGRGPVARSNVMGWLTRFFQSPLYPM